MSILLYIENDEGKLKKSAFELVTYGKAVSSKLNLPLKVCSVGPIEDNELKKLGQYGASDILKIDSDAVKNFSTEGYTEALAQAVKETSAEVVVATTGFNSKSLAPRLAAKLKGGLVSGVVDVPDPSKGFIVKKPVFSGKGFGYFNIKSKVKILTLGINSFGTEEQPVEAKITPFEADLSEVSLPYTVEKVEKETGVTPLPDCEIVVSGGRGLKGPENWHLVEDLAKAINAGTACSKPVSDMEWRPHHEHVGQTGTKISPNLYIAIGISGAVQHLAGVNSSKVIVVINKDPEAPFFKEADYGIVGDAFEVVPKLIKAAEKLQAAS